MNETIMTSPTLDMIAPVPRRILAFVIDIVILWIVAAIFGGLGGLMGLKIGDTSTILRALLMAAYFIGFHQSPWQATPGKRVMGMHLVRADNGGKVDAFRAFVRFAVLDAGLLLSLLIGIAYHDTLTGGFIQPMKPNPALKSFAETTASFNQPKPAADGRIRDYSEVIAEQKQAAEEASDQRMKSEISRKRNGGEALTPAEQKYYDALVAANASSDTGASGRSLFELLTVLYSLALLLAIMRTKLHTGFHDLLADTLVVNDAPKVAPKPIF